MPKVEDYVAYFEKLATEAGLPPEQAAAVKEALKNDKIRNGFMPLPNYSSDLDQAVARAKTDATSAAKAFYDDWFAREGKPAYDRALAASDKLTKYQTLYGELDGDGNGGNPNLRGGGLTKEEVQKMLSEGTAALMGPIVDMQKKSMRVATRHLREFNEVLDPNELEKFATENRLSDIDAAYNAYVAPRLQAKQQADWEAKVKAAKEEGAKEERSRLKVPTDYSPREYVNPFTKPRDKDADSPGASRDAFLAGWDEAANKK